MTDSQTLAQLRAMVLQLQQIVAQLQADVRVIKAAAVVPVVSTP